MKRVALLISLALFGCGGAPEKTANGTLVSSSGGTAEVQEITLSDGTRCAVMVGVYKAGISCDWRSH